MEHPSIPGLPGKRIARAVTFGRFSPIKKGHVRGIVDMLSRCEHLIVGVVDSSTPKVSVLEDFVRFCREADAKNDRSHTVFDLNERFSMTHAALSEFVDTGSIDVVTVPRPEYALDRFAEMFPVDEYVVMFSGVSNDPFDRERNEVMSAMLKRDVVLVDPSDTVVHNTQLLESIRQGSLRWEDIIPHGAYDLFLSYARKYSFHGIE